MGIENSLFSFFEQQRLRAGPFFFVLWPDKKWAVPGGGSATYFELVLLARRHGWRQPELVTVRVRCRVEDGALA